jgi:hypothetical protein
LGPPALPVVSTPCVAANAVAAEDKTSIAVAAAVAARSRGLRIWMHLFLEGIPAVRADPPGYWRFPILLGGERVRQGPGCQIQRNGGRPVGESASLKRSG